METTYQLVQMVDGEAIASTFTERNFATAMEVRGYRYLRMNRNARQRAELQNQPIFEGICGPCYGGPGIVRYESTEAYAIFSA